MTHYTTRFKFNPKADITALELAIIVQKMLINFQNGTVVTPTDQETDEWKAVSRHWDPITYEIEPSTPSLADNITEALEKTDEA